MVGDISWCSLPRRVGSIILRIERITRALESVEFTCSTAAAVCRLGWEYINKHAIGASRLLKEEDGQVTRVPTQSRRRCALITGRCSRCVALLPSRPIWSSGWLSWFAPDVSSKVHGPVSDAFQKIPRSEVSLTTCVHKMYSEWLSACNVKRTDPHQGEFLRYRRPSSSLRAVREAANASIGQASMRWMHIITNATPDKVREVVQAAARREVGEWSGAMTSTMESPWVISTNCDRRVRKLSEPVGV